MVSIKNDNVVAVGTVAAGAAATSVAMQNKEGFKNLAKNAFKVDSYKNMWGAVKDSFTSETVKKASKKAAKKSSNKAKGAAATIKNVAGKVKDATVNAAKTMKDKTVKTSKAVLNLGGKAKNVLAQKGKAFLGNIKWAKVGKAAGYAAVAAAAAIGVKSVYNYFTDNE